MKTENVVKLSIWNVLKNKVMEAPEKIYINSNIENRTWLICKGNTSFIEYIRTDAFINKAKKWFKMQNEGVDSDGNYVCDMTDFEDFKKYMEGE